MLGRYEFNIKHHRSADVPSVNANQHTVQGDIKEAQHLQKKENLYFNRLL